MQNFFDFTGKVVLITGASSGIGRATAELFGRCGASVAITYLNNKNGADGAVAVISSVADRPTLSIKVDVTKTSEIEQMIQEVEDHFGPVDILVNNAGSLIERLKTLEMTEERWNQVLNLNATSAFFAAKSVIPKMLEKGSGVIINVTSIAGRNGGAPGSIHYSSAKAAILTMTKGLAKEFAPKGIRINAVSPGVIDTPYHENFTTPEVMENLRKAIPMGREGRPDEVAGVIAFLASDAASYLCGETIEVNGGLLMD
jgi:3-oxoacyl-[acyl-carrier protein] reductase